MEKRTDLISSQVLPSRCPKWITWGGYAACAWALLFAAANIYLQSGAPDPLQQGESHHFMGWVMVLNLSVVPIKLLAAAIALALVQPWGERLPTGVRKLVLIAAWCGCAILVGYPLIGMSLTALVQTGLLATPPVGFKVGGGFQLAALLYGAFFLFAGSLFAMTAWSYQRRLKGR